MKLDKISFARLVGYIERQYAISFSFRDLEVIDDLAEITVPTPEPVKASVADVDHLLLLMKEGTRKIESIKAYRTLTGAGLKESKDAVERYWTSQPSNQPTLGDILPKKSAAKFARELIDSIDEMQKAIPGSDTSEYHVLRNFNYNELQKFRDFINSFDV